MSLSRWEPTCFARRVQAQHQQAHLLRSKDLAHHLRYLRTHDGQKPTEFAGAFPLLARLSKILLVRCRSAIAVSLVKVVIKEREALKRQVWSEKVMDQRAEGVSDGRAAIRGDTSNLVTPTTEQCESD